MKPCCILPFNRLNIEYKGNCTFCCPVYNNNYFIGNIFENSFEEIWYGEKAVEFRKSILDRSFKYCNLDVCLEKHLSQCHFYPNEKETDKYLYPPLPKCVNLSYISSCNVKCITCRDRLYVESKEDTESFNKINDKIIKLCANAEEIYLNGSGEIFASNHLKSLVKQISETYPKVKFFIHTNGLLCDEKHIKELKLEDKLLRVEISIHAASKQTYEKIVRGGKWEQLLNNLEYLTNLRKNNNFEFVLAFVIHSLNYKEIIDFVKMAKKLNAVPIFWRFRDWGSSEMCENIDKYAVWDSKHPEYEKFLKILNKLKRIKYNYFLSESFLQELQGKSKDPWYIKFLQKFKLFN